MMSIDVGLLVVGWDVARHFLYTLQENGSVFIILLNHQPLINVLYLSDDNVNLFISNKNIICTFVSHVKKYHPQLITDDGEFENRDKYGYFKCRVKSSQCDLVYTTNATRERYVSEYFYLLRKVWHATELFTFFLVNSGKSFGS